MEFLRENNPVGALLSRLMDLILLNVCCVFCSIPVLTIGASFTAAYDVCMKLSLKEEIGVVRAFFQSFAKNFRRSTLLFLISVAAGAFLILDFWSAAHWDTPFRFASQVVILSVGYFYLAEVTHVFPVLAYFGEPVLPTIRHAFILAMRNGIYTVFVMILNLIPVLMFFLFPQLFWRSLFIWFTFGFALLAYMNAQHLVRLFDPQRVKELAEAEAAQEREAQKKRNL